MTQLGGLQAQEPGPPFAGLWSRVEGFSPDQLAGALHERAVVRGTMMRATLHLVESSDYLAFRAALQPVLSQGMRALGDRAAGLDVDAVLAAARDLLEAEPRGFDELRGLLQEQFPEVNERALGFAVRMHLPLVMVPTGDRWGFPRVARFTLAQAWLGGAPLAEDDAASRQALVRHYLRAFGPATPADFTAWSGLKGAKTIFAALREELESLEDEQGRELFDLPGAPRPCEHAPAPPRLLPEFDSLVLAHSDRTRALAEEHRGEVVTKNLRVRATFLWDGEVSGTWRVDVKRRVAVLTLSPFARLPARAVKELTGEAERMLRFLEPDVAGHDVVLAS